MVNASEGRSGLVRPDEAALAGGRHRAFGAMAAVLAACLAVSCFSNDVFAQSSKKKADAEAAQKDAGAAAQRAYASGSRAFEAGDMAGAEQQLSVALSSGGLPNAQMARALYLRGTASRRLGKPAQAISDLTTAVWLKGGLSDVDKKAAAAERQLAYKEAGLGDTPPPIGGAPMDQSPKTPTATPASGAQVVQVTQQGFWSNFSMPTMPSMSSLTGSSETTQVAAAPTAESGQSSSFWSFLTPSSPAPASSDQGTADLMVSQGAAPAAAFSADDGAAAHTAWDTQTAAAASASGAQQLSTGYTASPVATGISTMGSPQPDTAVSQTSFSNPLAGTGTAVSNFFGNMFGGSSEQTVAAGAGQQGMAWGPDTTVATAQTSSMVQRGPDSPPSSAEALPWGASGGASSQAKAAPMRTASTGAGGRYKLQVAAVRSRAEAERLAQSLSGYQAVQNGTVSPEIDEAVIGSMGTFYRVRLGPYANEKEPSQLCKTLKPQGFDCMVVTQ